MTKSLSRLVAWALPAMIVIGFSCGTTVARAEKDINILMMGDSITAGGYYINTLQKQLKEHGYTPKLLGKCAVGGWYINNVDKAMGKYLSKPEVNQPNTYILLLLSTNNVGDSETKDSTRPTSAN